MTALLAVFFMVGILGMVLMFIKGILDNSDQD